MCLALHGIGFPVLGFAATWWYSARDRRRGTQSTRVALAVFVRDIKLHMWPFQFVQLGYYFTIAVARGVDPQSIAPSILNCLYGCIEWCWSASCGHTFYHSAICLALCYAV